MAGTLKMSINITGLKELRARVAADTFAALPWREGMEQFGTRAEGAVKAGAPVLSGRLQSSVLHRMQARPLPLWVKVKTTARADSGSRRKGYAYPARLEFDRKSRHHGWMRTIVRGLQGELMTTLGTIAHQIERQWAG